MATFSSRGLRGSVLEEMVNMTNDAYRRAGLALIQKIPTPITPIEMDKENRHITLAYFNQQSTVDYIGAVQGIPVCFDAKECSVKSFPLHNVHEHQVRFMEDFEKQNGIAFLLIYFSKEQRMVYLPFRDLLRFWERAESGGRKSISAEEMKCAYEIPMSNSLTIPYLNALQKDLAQRE